MITIREFAETVNRFGFIYSHSLQDAGGLKVAYFYKKNFGKKKEIIELQYVVDSGVTVMKKIEGNILIDTTTFDLIDFVNEP